MSWEKMRGMKGRANKWLIENRECKYLNRVNGLCRYKKEIELPGFGPIFHRFNHKRVCNRKNCRLPEFNKMSKEEERFKEETVKTKPIKISLISGTKSRRKICKKGTNRLIYLPSEIIKRYSKGAGLCSIQLGVMETKKGERPVLLIDLSDYKGAK